MRIRTIKPSLFTSYDIAALSLAARWTFIGLLAYVDDAGRGRDDPRLIKAAVWPIDDEATPEMIGEWMKELLKRRLICRYRIGESTYFHVVTFAEHQRINRPTPSKIIECGLPSHPIDIDDDESHATFVISKSFDESLPSSDDVEAPKTGLTESSLSAHGGLTAGKEGKGRERKRLRRASKQASPRQNLLPGMETNIDEQDPLPATAQRLIGEWIERLPARPHPRTINAVGRILKEALQQQGINLPIVRESLDEWITTGRPSSALRAILDGKINKAAKPPTETARPKCPRHRTYYADTCPYHKTEE